ncbi:NF-kappa-B essential modulator isoform X2 [Eurosta solidaginis]|uniref:NF-kappa-B essential modulator isoform X2 n=1 Tax=Eurosta solidaginis TaxID=178769 RepID=UPI003530A43B
MAEEESFVILGSCSQPNSSNSMGGAKHGKLELQQQNEQILTNTETEQPILIDSQFGSLTNDTASASKVSESPKSTPEQSTSVVNVWKKGINSSTNALEASMDIERSIGRDLWKRSTVSIDTKSLQQDDLGIAVERSSSNTGAIPKTTSKETKTEGQTKEKITAENPLAVSFIMGQVPADALKASIVSQFPSVSLEDCENLKTVFSDYLKMKDLIIQVNGKMNTWLEKKSIMHSLELENRQKLQECQEQIAALRNENLKLKCEMDAKINELTEQLSEKTALILKMRTQIEKLEAQQLASSKVVAQTDKEDKDFRDKAGFIARFEHERIVKNFERNMSQLLAEKLQVSDIQKQYSDEINCLKSNLKASEELVYQLQTDIAVLQSTDAERTAQFVIYTTQRDQMSEEIGVLRQQVDVYTRDFQLERTAREEMAGEKAQLLEDLRALQRVNQKLTEQVANHEERLASIAASQQQQQQGNSLSAAGAENTPTIQTATGHICPICSNTCSSLTALQEHVNQCLDKNVHT